MTKYFLYDGARVIESGGILGLTGSESGLRALEECCKYLVLRGFLSTVQGSGFYEITPSGEKALGRYFKTCNTEDAPPLRSEGGALK